MTCQSQAKGIEYAATHAGRKLYEKCALITWFEISAVDKGLEVCGETANLALDIYQPSETV